MWTVVAALFLHKNARQPACRQTEDLVEHGVRMHAGRPPCLNIRDADQSQGAALTQSELLGTVDLEYSEEMAACC